MQTEQMLMGLATAALCAAGLWHEAWFLEHTRKGRRLIDWFGTNRARWVLRGLLLAGALLGVLLACGVINPVRW